MDKYQRILLKLSGEALSGNKKGEIYDLEVLENILEQVKFLLQKDIEVSIVIGGGNIWRGEISSKLNINLRKADYMGMMATTINAVALESYLNNHGVSAIVVNSLNFEDIAKNMSPEEMDLELKGKKVIIFGGGTGKPFFSTDTAASLRAKQIKADVILIAKNNTNGVYDKDPNKYPDAKFINEISYDEILEQRLEVIDHSAIEILKDANIDLLIFNMNDKNFIKNLYNINIKNNKTIVYK